MQVLIEYKDIIFFIISLLCTLTLLILNIIVKIKSSKNLPVSNELKLIDLIKILCIDAEKLKNFTGEEKFNFVMTKIQSYCLDNNIKFDSEFITDQINSLIACTNLINRK
ncbi:hypothetical protein [Capybara microvirus Cap3_SP_444]|nr:hypothetical protein [Capybara microvirus Cap3_SP_444]